MSSSPRPPTPTLGRPSWGLTEDLSTALAASGCALVGHIEGTVAAPGHGDLAFHATDLEARRQR